MSELHSNRLEDLFQDFKPALTQAEAVEEAERCLYCTAAPCIQACPTEIPIPQFIQRIASGNLRGSAQAILKANIFGHSCATACPTEVLCEGACVYHDLNKKPISIGKLQRFAMESKSFERGSFFKPGNPTGKRVALIGAGPASLSCAHALRVLGHEAHVYEKGQIPGGLNTTGIAPYKMKTQVSLDEIKHIEEMGVVFHFGKTLGENLTSASLLADFDALFIGMGLGSDKMPGPKDLKHPRVLGAVGWIEKLKIGTPNETEGYRNLPHALVIGGGNTALDAARELRGIGAQEVVVVYRRSQSDMSGYQHEVKAACLEGVKFLWNTQVVQLGATSDTEVRCQLKDSSGERSVQSNLVLFATGQQGARELSRLLPELTPYSSEHWIDPKTGGTGHPRIFAGGDFANGGMEVVNAVAEGKRAAHSIDLFLSSPIQTKTRLREGTSVASILEANHG